MLVWQFEHFKTFVPYKIMQQAAASLLLFEGQNTDGVNPKMTRLTDMLTERTGHPKWAIERETDNLDIDTEGSIFRNKARLFSSLYIIVPPELLKKNGQDKEIALTGFGKALGKGYVSEKDYYNFIIQKFRYPHPCYSDYDEWVSKRIIIRPLIYILKTLVWLFENYTHEQAYLTSLEIALFLQSKSQEDEVTASNEILNYRRNETNADKIDTRKIEEMLALLAISGYVYIDSSSKKEKYFINLIDVHPWENTHYFYKRTAGGAGTAQKKLSANKLDLIKELWRN
ncbi:hypothetical protein J2W97_001745 [Paenibacillus jamilae]|nr:hypothetical protein [Paenibacillus jamilae]